MLSLQAQGCIMQGKVEQSSLFVVPASAGLYRSSGSARKPPVRCPCKRRVVSATPHMHVISVPLSLQAQGCIDFMFHLKGQIPVVPASAGLYLALLTAQVEQWRCPCKRRVVSTFGGRGKSRTLLSLQAQGCIENIQLKSENKTVAPASAGLN